MKVLDTSTLTHLFEGHRGVLDACEKETNQLAVTVISRIEILQGRFAMLLKAATGSELLRAQWWLDRSVEQLARIPRLLAIDEPAALEFDRLRASKKLKKIGRGDLLIAAITLAHRAALVTRNLKDFRLVPGLPLENWVD